MLGACEMAKPAGDAGTETETLHSAPPLSEKPFQAQPVSESAGGAEPVSAKMTLCQKELEALKQVSSRQHQLYQQEFGTLMHRTVLYAGMREHVNNNTQEALDALYQYKAKRLCANISQALLNGLAEMAESVK